MKKKPLQAIKTQLYFVRFYLKAPSGFVLTGFQTFKILEFENAMKEKAVFVEAIVSMLKVIAD